MGTRGTIHFKDGKSNIGSVYVQYDAYPSEGGLGEELFKMLNFGTSKIVNGHSGSDFAPKTFNGIGCLAAWVISQLKLNRYGKMDNPIGGTYMTTAKDRQEYNYFLSVKNEVIHLKITDSMDAVLFDDRLSAYDLHDMRG